MNVATPLGLPVIFSMVLLPVQQFNRHIDSVRVKKNKAPGIVGVGR